MLTTVAAAVAAAGVWAGITVAASDFPDSTATGTTTSATPAQFTPPPPVAARTADVAVTPDELKALLLNVSDLQFSLGVPELSMVWSAPVLNDWTTDRADCGGVVFPALRRGYDGTGFLGTFVEWLVDGAGDQFSNSVIQQVSSFPSSRDAANFVALEGSRWRKCDHQTVVVDTTKSERWRIESPRLADGVLTVSTAEEGQPRWGCQHTLTSRLNVAIDVAVCSFDRPSRAGQLAEQIAERIDQ